MTLGYTSLLNTRAIAIFAAGTCLVTSAIAEEPSQVVTEVVLASEVQWEQLNPARGDKSPQAATLWGDRNGKVETGFLVKFVDGFSSPPHIHNVTYRGVVVHGLVHNDDPNAKPMWMPKGSFWTQPAGEPHITSARGSTVAFIEIDKGPYLVMPTDEAFDRGERPVNIEASNIVWLNASDTNWIQTANSARRVEISFLWGKPDNDRPCGTLVRLPAGFSGAIRTDDSAFKAVVIEGTANLDRKQKGEAALEPGSYFHSRVETTHQLSCTAKVGCLLYIRSVGKYRVSEKP